MSNNRIRLYIKRLINAGYEYYPDRVCTCGCGEKIKIMRWHLINAKIPKYCNSGHINKNKKFSDEHCEKIRKSNLISMNKKEVKELIQKNRTPPVYDKKRCKEMSNITKKLWQNSEYRNKTIQSHIGKIPTFEARLNMSKAQLKLREDGWMCGENHPAYIDGRSKEKQKYCILFNDFEFRSMILQRDNNKCMNPCCTGNKDRFNRLDLHHIDYNKMNCNPDNIITLCHSCHSRSNYDRKWHKSWYRAVMYRRYGYEY